MRLLTLILAIVLFSIGCKNSSKKELSKEEKTKLKYDIVDMELDNQIEKIVLLAAIKKVPYDTLHMVLRDYYFHTDNIYSFLDSSKMAYDKAIDLISARYQIPKSKVASWIFSFKYELQTKDDVIDELEYQAEIENQDIDDDPRY